MTVHRAGSTIPPFDSEKARELLKAERPWTPDDFVCAGLFFRDYGHSIIGVVEAATNVKNLLAPGQVLLTAEQRHAVEDLKLELEILQG